MQLLKCFKKELKFQLSFGESDQHEGDAYKCTKNFDWKRPSKWKGIVLKPTKRQIHGGFLGTLAAIGIPMAIELASKIFGSGLQTPRKAGGKGAGQGLQTPRKAGTGLQVSQKPFLWQPPPFYGTWEGQGRGAKGKGLQGSGLLLGDNSPFNHIPILGAIL